MLGKNFFERVIDFFRESKKAQLVLFMVVLSALASFLVNINLSQNYGSYKLGEFADRNIKASQTVEFEDTEATEKAAKEAERLIPPVFDYDAGTLNVVKQRVHEAFRLLRQNPTMPNAHKTFDETNGVPLDDATYSVFYKNGFSWRMERAVLYVLSAVPDRYIVSDKDIIMEEGLGEILINDISSISDTASAKRENKRLKTVQLLQLVVTVNDVDRMMDAKIKEIASKLTSAETRAVDVITESLVKPNLTFNKEKTVRAKQIAKERIKKVIIKVNRGEVVVKEGEPIEQRQLMVLGQLKKASLGYHDVVYYLFYTLLFFLVFYSLTLYTQNSFYIYRPRAKDAVILGLCTLMYAIFFKIWVVIATGMASYFSDVPSEVFLLLFPYISMAFVVRIILTAEFSAIMSIVAAAIVGMMGTVGEGNFILSAYVLFSGFFASAMIMRFEERKNLFRAGLLTGIFQSLFAVAIIASKVYSIGFSWHHTLYAAMAGFASGLFASFVTEAIMPMFEYVFNYTTNLKLLELANTNHPLLRDFLIKAPASYNHCMIVGQLASSGASAVGANSLLARVGSYYHDVGKIGKAMYFIENQQGGMNPHDKLNPTMSARILVSHVRDGVRLAKEWKLGKPIIDIIEQHHGTSLMKFFYSKALEFNKDVSELDYRYPGPKPKTREAVLVMIADSCEAACRTLEEPTPARIKHTVDTIINNMFVDGQFDECNITLKRLKIISQIYTKILISLHHSRIEYPADTSEEQNGNIGDKRKWDTVTQKIVDKDGGADSAESQL
jgi:putative nucleotidyltransferase with HDIG domain